MTYTEAPLPESTTEHQCACALCDPALASPTERLGANHHSVAFSDSPRGRVSVLVDGEAVDLIFECLLGDDGWALAHSPDDKGVHLCRRCAAAPKPWGSEHELICRQRLTGCVTFQPKVEVA